MFEYLYITIFPKTYFLPLQGLTNFLRYRIKSCNIDLFIIGVELYRNTKIIATKIKTFVAKISFNLVDLVKLVWFLRQVANNIRASFGIFS